MKVGDYVRTKDGYVRKIMYIEKEDMFPFELDKFILRDDTKWRNSYGLMWWIEKEDIVKSSPNIIDLIEVGDYVNSYKVIDFMLENGKTKGIIVDGDIWGFDIDEIKSIVTKEQFESMEYKVKE